MVLTLVILALTTSVLVGSIYGWSASGTMEAFLAGYVVTALWWIMFASYSLGNIQPNINIPILTSGFVLASSASCLLYVLLKNPLGDIPLRMYGIGVTVLVACVFSFAALMADKVSDTVFSRLIKWYCIIGWPFFGFAVFKELQNAVEANTKVNDV